MPNARRPPVARSRRLRHAGRCGRGELREQTAELAVAREALEAERERYQELFQSAVLVTVAVVRDRQGAVRALRWLVRDPAGTGAPEPLLGVSIDQAIRQAERVAASSRPWPTSTPSRISTVPCRRHWTPGSACCCARRVQEALERPAGEADDDPP